MRPEQPAKRDYWPKVAAIGVIAGMMTLAWWESRDLDALSPVAAAPEPPAASTPFQPPAKSAQAPAVPTELPAVAAVAAFAAKELPHSPAARASTAEGMRLLATAIAARGDSVLWRDRAKRLGEAAGKVEGEADPKQAAHLAHDALLQAAEWIVDLPPYTQAASREPVVTAANGIREDEPLRDQAEEREAFFDAAAKALGAASI